MDLRELSRSVELEREILDLESRINTIVGLTNDEKEKLTQLYKDHNDILEQEYKLRQKTRTLNDGIFNMVKANLKVSENYLKMEKEQNNLKKSIAEADKRIQEYRNRGLHERASLEEEIVSELKKQSILNESSINSIGRSVIGGKNFAKFLGIAGGAVKGISEGFGFIFNIIGGVYDFVSKIWIDFDKVDHAVRDISVNMGLTNKQMSIFSKNTAEAAIETTKMGIGVEEVIKLQESMSENIGRNLILTKEQIKGVAEMSRGTSLGVEGVSSMGESFESFGINLDTMRGRIDTVFKTTQKLGLNSSKVFKLISENLKTAQKFNFKDGVKGLENMAKRAASIKLDLGGVFGMAEKLFELEGAVDLSAQLQVLGGSFAALGDPMTLIYQARNDVDGLTESLINATKGVAKFDKATGEFKIPAMELHRLRKVAEATGISLESLTEPALQLAKQEKAISQLANAFSYSKDEREAIANLAQMSSNGVFKIMTTDGTMKALSSLEPKQLRDVLGKNSSLEQAAKSRMTFLDMLKNIGNVFTSKLFPVLESISQKLMDSGLLNNLTSVAEKIGGLLSELFTSDNINKLISKVSSFIDGIKTMIEEILSGKDSFSSKIIKIGGNLIYGMLKEGIKMFIEPLKIGGIGALIGGGIGALGGPAGIMAGAQIGGMLGTAIGGATMINDGTVLPNSKVISQVTPNGSLKPLAVTNPRDTITATMSPGGNLNVNLNGTLKLDLGMGVTLDMRRDIINNPEFRYSILQLVSNNMTELKNGSV